MKGSFFTSDGVRLHYERIGEGENLIFIHGWSGSGEDFLTLAKQLATSYSCLLYDQRGHGFSDHPPWGLNVERLARDLRELLEFLEMKDCVFVGWSMGVSVILEYLKLYGEQGIQGLILMDSTPKMLPSHDWKAGLYQGCYSEEEAQEDLNLIFDNPQAFLGKFLRKMLPHRSQDAVDFLLKQKAQQNLPPPDPLALQQLWKDLVFRDDRDLFPSIALHVRIFRGEEPSLYAEEAALWMKKNLPQGEVVSFEKASHLLVLERPRQIYREIVRYMMELGKQPKRKGD